LDAKGGCRAVGWWDGYEMSQDLGPPTHRCWLFFGTGINSSSRSLQFCIFPTDGIRLPQRSFGCNLRDLAVLSRQAKVVELK